MRGLKLLAVVLLALFGQMERTYTLERAAHARAVATAKGRRIGRPSVVDPHKLAYAQHLREARPQRQQQIRQRPATAWFGLTRRPMFITRKARVSTGPQKKANT